METHHVGEADLVTLTLTAKAVERLGIETAAIAQGSAASLYEVAGEAVLPPGQALVVSAPVSGLVRVAGAEPLPGQRVRKGQPLFAVKPLLAIPRDLRVNAEAELEAAQARLEAAQERTARAKQMLADRVGSERALQDAQEAELVARTATDAAQAKLEQIKTSPLEADVEIEVVSPDNGVLQQIQAAPGQMVSAGSPLFQVARLDPIWVRTPIYSGDVEQIDTRAPALIKSLSAPSSERGRPARPAAAPPSADPLASTSDLFYALANPDGSLRPGERLSIAIPRRSKAECLQAPWESILYDINGGAWVYEQVEPMTYSRRRVAVDRVVGDTACLASGPAIGTKVVTAGAAELFGTEFGSSH
ncbi:MAG: efflux RND transporter periplasmic adaptor subunit [Bryobacterales bacterium]